MDPLIPPYSSEAAERAITQLLLEALPSGALVIDPRGRIAALNLQVEMVLGWAVPALEGQLVHEILRCRVEGVADSSEDCPVARVLQGSNAGPNGRMWVRCRDESLRPLEYHCVPYPTLGGVGAILAVRDLTHQMELEKNLGRLASIAEESPIAIVELNEDANLIHANPTMMSLMDRFGFTSEARPAVLPANIEKLAAECLETQAETGGIEVSVGGDHYEWKLVPVAGEKLVRAYGIDLTARKHAEIELIQAKARAETAHQAKAEFLVNTSQEIRAPVHVILGIMDLLAESGLSDKQLAYVRTGRSCAKSLAAIIQEILDMAALAGGRIKLKTTFFDLRAFMGETVAPFIRPAEEKNLQLTVTIGNKVPSRVQCDRERLKQVLHDLLSHAIQLTEGGEIAVEVDQDTIPIRPFGREKNEKSICPGNSFGLVFTVRRTGIGISRDLQGLVSDSFARADGSNGRHETSSVGLALSKQLIEFMGGAFGVESEPRKGRKFWFTLPIQEPVASEASVARRT